MKVLAAILMFVTLGVLAKAQTPPTPTTAIEAKMLGQIISNKGVKNAPFSADAISESVQVLADGNRIVRNSTSKMYRNSEGRFRQEITGGTGGMFGSFYAFGDGVSVINPMGGSFSLDIGAKIARVFDGFGGQAISVAAPLAAIKSIEGMKLSSAALNEIEARKKQGQTSVEAGSLSPEVRAEIEAFKANADKFKQNAEAFKVDADKMKMAAEELRVVTAQSAVIAAQAATTVAGSPMFAPSPRTKWETRTEELGEQNIEGVSAMGTRTITTIPAGAIGNDRPIETIYEKWYSPELHVVVLSKHSDPRFGEQTYRLTNINRTEPDPSLFQVPSGYKVVSGGKGGAYSFSTKAQAAERAAATRAAQPVVTKTRNQN